MENVLLDQTNISRVEYLRKLEEVLPSLFSPPWYRRRRTIAEIAEMCRLIADARALLWAGVYNEYPHVRASGGVGWQIVGHHLMRIGVPTSLRQPADSQPKAPTPEPCASA